MKRSRIGRMVMSGVLAVGLWSGPAHANDPGVWSLIQSDELVTMGPSALGWYAFGVIDGANLVLDYWLGVAIRCPSVPTAVLTDLIRQHALAVPPHLRPVDGAVFRVRDAVFEIGCTVEPAP
jgi:hypothetical protein